MSTATEKDREKVRKLAEAVGGSVYEDYSGRGMFGARCLGVSCSDSHEAFHQARRLKLKGVAIDSLGKGFIVYWPHLRTGA